LTARRRGGEDAVVPRDRGLLAIVGVVALCGCGGKNDAATTKPTSPPARHAAVTIGAWEFVEEDVLSELYAHALRAQGFPVTIKRRISTSEVIDHVIRSGAIDLYPEYVGIILSNIARDKRTPASPRQTYARAATFERGRGLRLLAQTPFEDKDAIAVRRGYAKARGLRSVADLKRLGDTLTIGAPPEFQVRQTGLLGLRRVYGIHRARFRSFPVPQQYTALDRGIVQAIDVSTTDAQLQPRRYVVLRDPRNVFGFEHVAPVVRETTLQRGGPQLARTLNAVSRLLTTSEVRAMNVAVVERHARPAAVARAFLRAHGLI
jgi:osmoprotectant transport system substrate-binding protein